MVVNEESNNVKINPIPIKKGRGRASTLYNTQSSDILNTAICVCFVYVLFRGHIKILRTSVHFR